MNAIYSLILSSGLIFVACASNPKQTTTPAASAAPAAQVSPTPPVPAPGTAISLDESQKAEFPITADEKKKLTRQFKKALTEESAALDHQEKSATKELVSAQSQRAKNWKEQEKKARHAYFAEHTSGAERRKYVQDYQQRLKDFDRSLKDEAVYSKNSWKQKKDYLKESQKERETQFKASLDQNKRPPASLWPQGH